MNLITSILSANPLLCLFLSVTLGYLLGKIRVKSFVVGGTIGSLVVAIGISCIGGTIHREFGELFLALFLFAVGYEGGESITLLFNRSAIKHIFMAILMAVVGGLSILLVAKLFHLSKGMAVGVAAGALTQSAIIGSANDVLQNMSAANLAQYNADVSEGYSVGYFFGVVGSIVWCITVLEFVMKRKIFRDSHLPGAVPKKAEASPHNNHAVLVLSAGLTLGFIIGLIKIQFFGIRIDIGVIGCLISGLFFGWLQHRKVTVLRLREHSLSLLRDYGLLTFMATVGLGSGNRMLHGLLNNGLDIVGASIIVSLLPFAICTFIGIYIMKYKNVAILAGALAGSHCSNSTAAVIMQRAGVASSVPMQPFIISFVISSILLTFIGPIIVMLV